MSLTAILLLIAFAGLAAALWAMLSGFGLDPAAYRRRQRRAGLALLALLVGIGLVQAGHDARIVERLTAPEVDGVWAAVTVDGRPVPWGEWRVAIRWGKVAGGRDGCNVWSFAEPEVDGGERMIHTTLAGCPEDDPVYKAYWSLAAGPGAAPQPRGDGTLRLAGAGHEAIFRRCRWTDAPPTPGGSGTPPRICAPDGGG